MNIKRLLSCALIIFIFGYFSWNIYHNWVSIKNFSWDFKLEKLFLFILFILPAYFYAALSWFVITRNIGGKISFSKAIRIWVFSNFGRFVPGVIWQYAGRIYLCSKEGMPKMISATSLLLEAMFALVASILIILVSFVCIEIPLISNQKSLLVGVVLVAIVITFVLVIIFLTNYTVQDFVIRNTKKIFKDRISISSIHLETRSLPVLVGIYSGQIVIGGSALFFLAQSLVDFDVSLYLGFVGIYAISWMVGYLSFISPSGLGIQEASMTALLSFYMPIPIAVIISLLFRLASVISELITFFLVLLFLNRKSS